MVPWFVILISQLRFRQAHKKAIASHPFRSILFLYANYLTMAFLICVLIGMYFNEDTSHDAVCRDDLPVGRRHSCIKFLAWPPWPGP